MKITKAPHSNAQTSAPEPSTPLQPSGFKRIVNELLIPFGVVNAAVAVSGLNGHLANKLVFSLTQDPIFASLTGVSVFGIGLMSAATAASILGAQRRS